MAVRCPLSLAEVKARTICCTSNLRFGSPVKSSYKLADYLVPDDVSHAASSTTDSCPRQVAGLLKNITPLDIGHASATPIGFLPSAAGSGGRFPQRRGMCSVR